MPYSLTPDDEDVFEVAIHNGSAFTAYYFQNSMAETRDGHLAEGWQFIPWQLRIHHGPEPEQCIIGGFGSGKTAGIAMSAFTYCAMVPHFMFLEAAPVAWQSKQMYDYIVKRLPGSRAERFVEKYIERPYPKVLFRNGSSMEFMSADEQAAKILTWEGDWICLDQAENVDNLDQTCLNLATRLRGGRPDGSPRLGRLTLLANAGDSPELWDFYDQHETFPADYLSMQISYEDNIFLSERDIKNLFRRAFKAGGSRAVEQWLKANRPEGGGEHFPMSLIEPSFSPALQDIMNQALAEGREGFVQQDAPKCGVVWWEMPADEGREYLVVGDIGQNNPPHRGSPVIFVWDITNFPERPAVMRCFRWIFGNGSFQPFWVEYKRLVDQYHAHGQNAFDSTGAQKGMDELAYTTEELVAEGMNMAGQKFLHLNSAKQFFTKILWMMPYLKGLSHQLTHYRIPDTRIRQDLVMVLAMSAGWMRRLLWGYGDVDDSGVELPDPRSPSRTSSRDVRLGR